MWWWDKTATFETTYQQTGNGVCAATHGDTRTFPCNVHTCTVVPTTYTSLPDYPVITNVFFNITNGTLHIVLNPVARVNRYYISVQNSTNRTVKTLVVPEPFGKHLSILITESWLKETGGVNVDAGVFMAVWAENNIGERYSVYKREIDASVKGDDNALVGLSSRSA